MRAYSSELQIPSAVSDGGVVREDTENRWQENQLLTALCERDRARLIPQLEILTFFAKEVLYQTGEEIRYVYFPLDCIVVLISSVDSGATVKQAISRVLDAPSFAEDLAVNGLTTIRQRHTCGHRVDELLGIYAELRSAKQEEVVAGY